VFLHEDPERAWVELGQHFLWEAVHYGAWKTDDMHSVMHVPGATTVEEVRASGRYLILSPDELISRLEGPGGPAYVTLHPLCGGMPVEEAWRSVHLLTDNVLVKLRG
jgi:hypothetical protein